MEASHSEGPRVLDLTSFDHDHGPRDLGKGRKGWSEEGLGCGGCEGLGGGGRGGAAVGVWGSVFSL